MARPSSHTVPVPHMVLSALRKSRRPLSAYGILEKLKKQGVNTPPVIYRALQKLIRDGSAHRIERLNAYVACRCADHHTHRLSVLTICQGCDAVEELHSHAVMHHLEKLRSMGVNLPEHAVMELPVVCRRCAK